MKLALLCIGGAVLLLLVLFWCMTQIHFRIGSRHLKVMLFRVPIRRIALANIAYASKREPKAFAERWYSTLKTSHRLITIERKRGLIRRVCITPQNRYVFLADLKSAVRRVDPNAEWAAPGLQGEASFPQPDEQPPELPAPSARVESPRVDPG